jgi:hypothetical protein
MNWKIALSAIACLSVLSLKTAIAHHGFDGAYDRSQPIYLEGTVKEVSWQSPHSILTLAIPKNLTVPSDLKQATDIDRLGDETLNSLIVPAQMLGKTQQLEFPPVGSMVNPLRDRLQAGDRVAAIVYRNCQPPNQLRVQFVRLSDGMTVVRPGTVQTEVNSCS